MRTKYFLISMFFALVGAALLALAIWSLYP